MLRHSVVFALLSFALLSHRTAGIRTIDIRTLVSSHFCWPFRTVGIRTVGFALVSFALLSFALLSYKRSAGIRTFDIRTLVSFALLTLSHCWPFRTVGIRTVGFELVSFALLSFALLSYKLSYKLCIKLESSWNPGPERRHEDSGTSKDVSRPRIEPGSQDLASCAITARPPQHDTTGPRHRAFDVFQGSFYKLRGPMVWKSPIVGIEPPAFRSGSAALTIGNGPENMHLIADLCILLRNVYSLVLDEKLSAGLNWLSTKSTMQRKVPNWQPEV